MGSYVDTKTVKKKTVPLAWLFMHDKKEAVTALHYWANVDDNKE